MAAKPILPDSKTPIRTRKKKPSGRVRGIKVKTTEAMVRANRGNAWKHGRYARSVTLIEQRASELERVRPGAAGVMGAFFEALEGGDTSGADALGAVSLTESEMTRQDIFKRLRDDGLTVIETLMDKDGREIGQRMKAHPLLESGLKIVGVLGHTASDMQLTRKSRGEGAKDEAIAASLKRDLFLRGLDKAALAPPPED
jgi:hypothetical protein